MEQKMLVLDFDGTITDAEAEGGPFRTGYLEDVSILTGIPIQTVLEWAKDVEEQVASDPTQYGWKYDGHIVAPATVDPYLRMMPVARGVMDRAGVFLNEGDRDRLLDGILYKYNYPKTHTVFRDNAHSVLQNLTGTSTYVVTNSHTEPVQEKIRTLDKQNNSTILSWLVGRVNGRAKKYILDPSFERVQDSLEVPNLNRPIKLRRRHYFEVLEQLMHSCGASWGSLTVVGDIFELDLALPLAMGSRIGLVVNDFTPDYEKDFVKGHPRGTLIHSLQEIPVFWTSE